MAEIALIASIVQIADTGFRLSLKLYTFGEAVSSADRAIITISKDISVLSVVLKELGQILGRDQDDKERICSDNFVQTAGDTVKECLGVFEELDKMILEKMPNLSQGNKATRAKIALERLWWPFIQPRIQLLRGNLDMLRANISLMLNVLIYARQVSERRKLIRPNPGVYEEAGQRILIEELANAKDEYIRKFEYLKLSGPPTKNMHNIDSRAAPVYAGANLEPKQHSLNPLPRATVGNPPAPEWPLPNKPALYPRAPKDFMTVQSDQSSSWQLLDHLKTLLASLLHEVDSPKHQIPAESRLRFNGAIRGHYGVELKVLAPKRREPSKSGGFGVLQPNGLKPLGQAYQQYGPVSQPYGGRPQGQAPQPYGGRPQGQAYQPYVQKPYGQEPRRQAPQRASAGLTSFGSSGERRSSAEAEEGEGEEAEDEKIRELWSVHGRLNDICLRVIRDEQNIQASKDYSARLEARSASFGKAQSYDRSFADGGMQLYSSVAKRQGFLVDSRTSAKLETVGEAGKNDVVDDLLKLWTVL